MQCTSPTRIWIEKDGKGDFIYVPCGHCAACRRAKKREWTIRLIHEASCYDEKCFITLTYRDEDLPIDSGLHKSDLQGFFKRLRKRLGPRRIRYFACGEYGDRFNRPHYHAIVFGLGSKDEILVAESWPFGFVKVEPVTLYRFQYVAGYVQKKLTNKQSKEVYGSLQPPFQLQSQGIGRDYVDDNAERLCRELGCKTFDGSQYGLPRYYRKRLGDALSTEFLKTESVKRMKATLERHGIKCESDSAVGFAYYCESSRLGSSLNESRRIAEKSLIQKLDMSLERRKKK